MSAPEVDTYIRKRGALYGTAADIDETIQGYIDFGCSGFMVFCNSAPVLQNLDILASLGPVRRTIVPVAAELVD